VAKNGNGEGGITRHKKSGLYMARYTVQTATGSKRKALYGKTRSEVAAKLSTALADREGGPLPTTPESRPSRSILRAGYQTVSGIRCARGLTSGMRASSGCIWPRPSGKSSSRLSPRTMCAGSTARSWNGGLAPRTVLHIHRTLSKALKQATDDGLIPRNAAGPVKPPRPRREEILPLNREQVRALFEAAREDRLEALYVGAVTAGLRRGELQGLKWEDLDLEAGTLQVRRTLSEPRGGYIFEAPKSGKGRNIRLTQRAKAALREHRKRQLEEQMRVSILWQENGLVFPSSVGTPLSGGNLNRAFKALLKRAELPEKTRFHDLRHTCATLLLKQGVNSKLVQDLLGHADASLTLNVYSHVLPDMGDIAAGARGDALG
jgi:integrase